MAKRLTLDPELRAFATPRQLEYFDAIMKHGGVRAAARALKADFTAVSYAIVRLKASAARRGYAPDHDMTRTVPDGFKVRGVSTLYDKDGKQAAQWVKSTADEARQQEMMRATIAALSEEVRGLSPLVAGPRRAARDLLAVFPIGDPHCGMLSWQEECGEAFDLAIARKLTLGAVDRLMQCAPAAETGIILLLGDVFHMNDQTNQTPAHRHQLDVDSRYVKVLQVGVETYRHAIIRALEKYNRVVVRCVAGNHDPEAIWALSFTLAAYFSNQKRVTVDLSPAPFWYYRFGKVLIGSTHGDKVKHEQLGAIMACDKPTEWGDTKHRYWYTGHVHHQSVKEFPGVVCESFRTLAAKDAYATGHGYRAGRDMVCIVHHKEHGEVERHRCDVGML